MTQLSPVLSRTVVTPSMALRGMKSAAELAQGKPCGTRLRYYAGCRCVECKAANTAYESGRAAARRRGEGNGLVSAEPARKHLLWLSAQGVGRKTAADSAKVSHSIVSKIIDGQRQKIRAQTERRILAVTTAAAADGAFIDAGPTWLMLDELIASGYSRAFIASQLLGRRAMALQISRGLVTVRNAYLVSRLYACLRYASLADSRRAQALLAELREECFRPERVLAKAAEISHAKALPAPTFEAATKGHVVGRMRAVDCELVKLVHQALMGQEATE